MSAVTDNKVIQTAGGRIAKPELALADVEAYLTQATPGLVEGLSNLTTMAVVPDDIETEEINKREAAADLARARTARDDMHAGSDTPTSEGAEIRTRRSSTEKIVEAAAEEKAEERVRASVTAYNTASKALETAERRRDLRFNTAQMEREKGLAEFQSRFTQKALQVLLPGTTGLAFTASPDGSHVTPGAAVRALRAHIAEKPVVPIREQTAATLKIVDGFAASLDNGKAAQGWRTMITQLATEAHTRGTSVPAFTGQAVGRLIIDTLTTALTPKLGGGSTIVTLLEKRVGSGKGDTDPLGHQELLDLLKSPTVMREITETVEKVMTRPRPGAGGQANRAGEGSEPRICVDFKRGTCAFGDHCKYSHTA